MICKEDVINWFKNLESYERIDIMCTMLSMCLPFELRFLGTCLEDLGRRDSQEFRVMELRVNNQQELASDMVECQKGEPTDRKIRRKMALYLALIRSCNRTCVAEIFRTLDSWGQRDFTAMNDLDTLQELLLVYIMAANHPVFSFEQHIKCTEIFKKIRINKLVRDETCLTETQSPMSSMISSQQQPLHAQLQHIQTLNAVAIPSLDIHHLGQTPQPSQEFPQPMPAMHTTPFLLPPSVAFNHQLPIDAAGVGHVPSLSVDPKGFACWQFQPSIEQPPQSSSPLLSQQSSPSSSRAGSPNRGAPLNMNVTNLQAVQQQQQQQIRNMPQRIGSSSMKNVRRPSADTTPPPMTQQQQQQQQQQLSNDILPVQQNLKTIDDNVNEGNVTPLHNVILNGFRNLPRGRVKNANPHHQQQQQQSPLNHVQHFPALATGSFNTVGGVTYAMHNLSMSDPQTVYVQMDMRPVGMGVGTNAQLNMGSKSGGSDSGSSIGSSGEISPSETPTIMTSSATSNMIPGGNIVPTNQKHPLIHLHQQQVNVNFNKSMPLTRLNGRGEKQLSAAGASGANVGSTGLFTPGSQPSQQDQAQQITQPQHHFSETILAPGGNAGAGTTISSNNNLVSGIVTSPNSNFPVASNNNSAVLISPSPVSTINNVILQQQQPPPPQQQQAQTNQQQAQQQPQGYAPAYPFASGRHFMGLSEVMYQPSFRILQHTSNVAAGVGVTPTPAVQRPGSATSGIVSTNATVPGAIPIMLHNDPRLIPFPHYSTLTHPGAAAPSLGGPPISSIPKPTSCYNCGSQTHTGRDCQEANMEDVTRRSIYKLNYSASAAATGATSSTLTTVSSGNNLAASGGVSSNSGSTGPSSLSTTDSGLSMQQQDSLHSNPASAAAAAGMPSAVQPSPAVQAQPVAVASNK